MYKILLLFMFIGGSLQQVKIKCYDCITPIGVASAVDFCNSSLSCDGVWCTKGPDAQSNGIYHGCSDAPPVDATGPKCKTVTTKIGSHVNCYCKNIDFCNSVNYLAFSAKLFALLIFNILAFGF